ncbi:hypothetical protein [Microbacterium sp. TWP3-1-2b2]|uniref:hypothetical protein n=1 Tax=Microbacterium sp. TWP3-1-2b2 TaxID=2804651 RepID=UPI003CEF1D40
MTSQNTASVPLQSPRGVAHEHGWSVESRHPTSGGTVLYVRCTECGVRRVDVQRSRQQPPEALSHETASPSERR